MLAHVDDGVRAPHLVQPAVEGVVEVGRRQVGLVVDGVGVHVVAARRLEQHDHVAELQGRHTDVAVIDVGLAGRLAPLFHHAAARGFGQLGEPATVEFDGHADVGAGKLGLGQEGLVVGAALQQGVDERVAVIGSAFHAVAGRPHGREEAHQRGGRVQPHGVAHLLRLVGGVGEHEGHPLLGVGLVAQAGQAQGKANHAGHTPGVGRVAHHFQPVLGRALLEGDGHGDEATVELRQGHVHGRVQRIEPPGRHLPLPASRAGRYGLEDGNI